MSRQNRIIIETEDANVAMAIINLFADKTLTRAIIKDPIYIQHVDNGVCPQISEDCEVYFDESKSETKTHKVQINTL